MAAENRCVDILSDKLMLCGNYIWSYLLIDNGFLVVTYFLWLVEAEWRKIYFSNWIGGSKLFKLR